MTSTAPRTHIKICGIRTPDIARAALDAGADAIGLNFALGTPRAVTLQEAEAILRILPPMVEPIGVFVNATPAAILDTCRQLGLRTAQLHGKEAPASATALAPLRVIKAIPFEDGVAARLADWTPASVPNLTAILWDAPPPPKHPNQSQTGGHGQPIDWPALANFLSTNPSAQACPSILAGGLRPDNVAQAIAQVRPYAVDVSSGVESSRGIKDPALITAFCQAVQAADANR